MNTQKKTVIADYKPVAHKPPPQTSNKLQIEAALPPQRDPSPEEVFDALALARFDDDGGFPPGNSPQLVTAPPRTPACPARWRRPCGARRLARRR
jgi:hypothetical protein